MSDDDGWIVIPNWGRFQHYQDRDPIWIKNYCALTGDDDYLKLTLAARGVLHGVWLEYARADGQLSARPQAISRRLGIRTRKSHLEELNRAGFVQVVASRPPALSASSRARGRTLAREEKRRKRTVENDLGKLEFELPPMVRQ